MLSRLEVLLLAQSSLILANLGDKSISASIFGILFSIVYTVMLFKDMEYVGRKRT